jgi:RHS repeat-associated protein
MNRVAMMNNYLRVLALISAWLLAPAPAHAAWTATDVTGLSTTPVGFHPVGIFVYPPARAAAVLNKEADTEWIVNLDTGALSATKQLNIGVQPNAIALNPAITELWVADDDGKRLLRFSISSRSLIEKISLPFEPTALAFNADGSSLFVADEDRIHILDVKNRTQTGTVSIEYVQAIAFWPSGNRALAIDDRNLYVIDPTSATVETVIPVGSALVGLTIDPSSGVAYIADRHTNAVAVVDLATRTFRGRFALPDEPAGIAFDSLHTRVLVTLKKLGQLASLDPATAVLLPTIFLDEKLTAVAVDNKVDTAVALTAKNKAIVLNLLDKSSTDVALPAKPRALGIDESRHLALVALSKKLGLRFLDLTTRTLLPSAVPIDTQARAIAVDPGRGLAVVVVKRKDQLLVVDVQNRQLLATLAIAGEFRDVAIHTGKGIAYVVNQAKSTGEVVMFDLATRAVTGTITVSKDAESIVVDEELNVAVVAIEEQNKLEVIDLNTNHVVATYALTKHPRRLALNPVTHAVIVTSKDSNQIALLDLAGQTLTANFAVLDKPLEVAITTRFNQALITTAEKGEVLFLPLPNPVPVLTEIVPAESPVTPALALVAVGDKFIDGASKVVLNGQFLTTRWKDTQHLEADVPPSILAAPGRYPVKVVTASGGSGGGLSGGGGDSATLTFSVDNPAPVLTNVAPATLLVTTVNQTLTLTGSKFVPTSQVFFGAQALATMFVSPTQLTAVVPGAFLTQSGSVPVTVFNPTPGGGTSAAFIIAVVGARPTISDFTPKQGPLGMQVTITGTNFDALNPGSNNVRFNGASAVVVSAGTTQLKVIVPTTATTGPISVTTQGGSATSTDVFTVQANQDFDLVVTPTVVQMPVNGFGTTRIKLTSTGLVSYTQLASINVSGLPTGLSFTLDRPSVFLNQDVLLTLTSNGAVAPGTYTISVEGRGLSDVSPLTRPKTFTVQVLDATATTVTGRVLHAEDDSPFVGARVRLGTQSTTSDDTGGYRFVNPSVIGDQVVLIDAGVLNSATIEYPSSIAMPVLIVANKDNPVLTSYVRGIEPQKFTPVSPGQETHVTAPEIPNYELHIPQGAILYGFDGQPVTKINVKVVPVDRLPVKPLPDGVTTNSVYLYYFFKDGGANPTRPIPVTMNNDIGALPGEKINLWYFDESLTPNANSNQWRIMGTGTVTQDGKSIVSDPGVGIPKFCCGASFAQSNGGGPDDDGGPGGDGGPDASDDGGPSPDSGDGDGDGPDPDPPEPPNPCDGNPVDLTNGAGSVFEPRHFGIRSLSGVNLNCRYRSTSNRVGFFGRGTSFSYDWFAEQVGAQSIRVTTPKGARYLLSLQGDGMYRATTGKAGAIGIEAIPTTSGRTVRLKNGTAYDFNSRGQLIARRSKAGNAVQFALDSNGFVRSITDATGHVYTIETTTIRIGRVIFTVATKMVDSLGRSQSFAYDTQARLTAVTDTAGNAWNYEYDTAGRVSKKTDARGAITQYTYDANGRTTQETLSDGSIYQFAYTLVGNTVTETRVTNPNGNVTTYRFNGQGYTARRIDALGRIFKLDIDYATNFLTDTVDPIGRVTRYTYDSHGNRTSVVDPEGNTTIVEYDQTLNKPTRIINALGNITTLGYNDQGKLAAVINPEGETTSYTYTATGQFAAITDPLGHVMRFDYDNQGNRIKSTDSLGRTRTARYDSANRLIEAIDGRGRSTQFGYDTLDRLTQVLDALGNTTAYTYDAKNNRLTVTDPKGAVIETNAYDLRNRLTTRTDALNQTERYTYDGVGNLTQYTDKKSQVTSYTYDPINRIARRTRADGRTSDYTYDLLGNLIRVSDSVSGECLYAYDDLNRLISETTDRGVITYSYDALGRLTERRINGTDPTQYVYDKANRIKTISYRASTVTYTYDRAGRLTSRILANGITQAYAWSDANELLSITYRKSDGTVIEQLSYTYDQNGNRITRNRTGLGSVPESAFSATYDANNRMLAYTPAGSTSAQPLTYDANGNLSQRQTPQGTIGYTWDAQNRLIGISGPNGSASFKYDYRGRRIEKTINGATTAFLYDGAQAVAELQGSSIGATYLTGLQIDEVLARYTNQGNRTLLTDALGAIVAQSDDSQTNTTIYGYSPYGEATQLGENNDNSLQYTGRENDNTGVYYYRARYYDPQLKRFISQDPVGLAGGGNWYGYGRGNPQLFKDPLGLWTLQIGVTINIQIWGPFAAQFTAGVAIDGNGNVGTYYAGGGGLGAGAHVSGGISTNASNASTICDLAGPFVNISAGGGWGPDATGDAFYGKDGNGNDIWGGGVTVGAGLGVGGSATVTDTVVNPIGKLW